MSETHRSKSRLVVRLGLLLAAVVLVDAPRPAVAWGWDGHRIIGRLAARNLTPAARTEVEKLLEAGGQKNLAEASVWADSVRSEPEYRWSSPHHYINAPDDATSFDLERDCPPERGCAVRAIEEHAATLRSGEGSLAERAEALYFLAHFAGDLHQPLHAAYGSDRGGNSVEVTFYGEPTNLHRVWDYMILERDLRVLWWKRSWKSVARRLARAPAGTVPAAAELDPMAWATESFELAREQVYRMNDDRTLGDAYADRGLPLVERRLLQAGLRLAGLLNEIFAGP